MEGKESLPDHQRCNRTDGRSWRCRRPVKEGKKLCEIHYLQGLHRQNREKVPESLKIQRQCAKKLIDTKGKDGLRVRGQKIEKSMKMKRRSLARELVRMVVKREVEKRKEAEEGGGGDMMRRLPNGIMVISQYPARPRRDSCNAGALLNIKVGIESGIAPRRRFRSKNIEPLPIGSVQVLPYKRNGENVKRGGSGRKKCHWCKSRDSSNLIKCSNCRKEFYCMDCIKERYFDTQEEVKRRCPSCRRTCRCKACLDGQSQGISYQGDESVADRILSFHYLICLLLPILKQLDQDQSIELELEAKVKGLDISELQIAHDGSCSEPTTCNNCKTSILDLHRSCSNCLFALCLSCWWDFCKNVFPKGMKALRNACANKRNSPVLEFKELNGYGIKSIHRYKQIIGTHVLTTCSSLAYSKACDSVGGISCPTIEFGGCGNGVFDLRSSFPLSWIKELETKAEEIVCCYDYPDASDGDTCCSICDGSNYGLGLGHLQQAAKRKYSNDNLLYYPSALEVCADKKEHFQKHWCRGHPVVVHDVLQKVTDLSWDPVSMFYTYLEGSTMGNQWLPPSLDCCEVEISIKQFFWGPLRGRRAQKSTGQEMLKLKALLTTPYFREQFPRHYSEIVHQLPLQEYVNPVSGILNLAAKSQLETLSPELGPYVCISYNSSDEQKRAHCVLRLGYDLYDTVNILAHTTDDLISSENLNKIRKLMRKHQAQNEQEPTCSPGGQFSLNKGDRESPSCAGDNHPLTEMSTEELLLQQKISRVSWVSSDELPRPSHQNGSISQDQSPASHTILSQNGHACRCNASGNGYHEKDIGKFCGAQWDIFRREDVPKLMEYFQRHSSEFTQSCGSEKNVFHPILDQCFFLDEVHKMRLREEFKIEPWTVVQHVGEAVIVPVGCPYQIRNLKSCVSVVLHFISPESVKECIHLMDEVQSLPDAHGAKLNKLDVKRMALNSLKGALKEVRELTCGKQVAD